MDRLESDRSGRWIDQEIDGFIEMVYGLMVYE